MRAFRYLNPVFVYRNRALIKPYLQSYAHDAARCMGERLNSARVAFAERGLGLTPNDRQLAALRNRHAGQRCFVIGTGPSLAIGDLERLEHEVTFASNRIYACFNDTAWRPTYYATTYLDGEKLDYGKVARIERSVKLLPLEAQRGCPLPGALYFRWLHEEFYPGLPKFGGNALHGLYAGGTVTYVLLQLAYYMGIQEVYLLGVDFNYRVRDEEKHGLAGVKNYIVQSDQDHFHPDYLRPGEISGLTCLYYHELAYQSAKNAFEKAGRRIFNATRGGKLEIFPRVNLDDVLGSGGAG